MFNYGRMLGMAMPRMQTGIQRPMGQPQMSTPLQAPQANYGAIAQQMGPQDRVNTPRMPGRGMAA
jgi:hypothetical protein